MRRTTTGDAMRRIRWVAIVLLILSCGLYGEAGRWERIGVSINALGTVLGEAQVDLGIKYGDFELSLKPGLRFVYPLESGGWVPGRGVSLRPTFRRYFTPTLFLGLTVPAILWIDPPNPMLDLALVFRTGVAPLLGWRYVLGPLLLSVELGAGIGAQNLFVENPKAYGVTGWFVLHGELGVGFALRRKEP
jgi:hypothetical protein